MSMQHFETQEGEFQLKPLSREGIQAALSKAEKYRLLNDPSMAESICLDILKIDPDNKDAAIVLLLALTDQFGNPGVHQAVKQAKELANGFKDDYNRLYYSGIIHERQGTNALNSGNPGSHFDAYEWYTEAMKYYEKSEAIQPQGNDDAILRWNTCTRIIAKHKLGPRPKDDFIPILE
ncbi:hypothetical protein QQ008_14035 [Fulvivirgaceae bacterium BMA10]|uniref:Tetratricopeptide repeat protein n=1 Tax=Splendidivirga corallicola TaxID=3051826 RepID=A0ABT8KR67_9BACT|nr:hypothetical protein [Fulvivirgaceae bacterium BMA10]